LTLAPPVTTTTVASVTTTTAAPVTTTTAVPETCPVVYQRDWCSPEQSTSLCWSPGEPDFDCPNNGICCFDGCSNQCGIPTQDLTVEVPTTTAAPECTTVLVYRNETVLHEMCAEAPGPDVCHSVWEDECKDECKDEEKPEEVCTTQMDQICTDKPCYPVTELVDQTDKECVTSPEECHTVPEEECKNVTETVCDHPTHETANVCQEVWVSGGECGSKVVCKEELGIKCKANKESQRWRREAGHDATWTSKFGELKWKIEDEVSSKKHEVSSKKHELKAKLSSKADQIKGKLASKADKLKGLICWPAKIEKCRWVPKECSKQVCHEEVVEVAPTCHDVTTPSCSLVEREECVPARETCTDVTKQVPVQSTKHCPMPPQQNCRQVENKVCKVVKKRDWVCKPVCKSVEKTDCQPGKPVENCWKVPKTVTYQVPKKVCSPKW